MTTRVRLSIDLVLPESVTAGEWAATLGQALDVLDNVAAHPPVVRAAFLEPAREVTLRDVLHAELDAADLAVRNKISALSEIAAGTETGDAIVEALTGPEPVLSTREQAEAARKAADIVQQTSGADAAYRIEGHRIVLLCPCGRETIRSWYGDWQRWTCDGCGELHARPARSADAGADSMPLCRCSHEYERHDRVAEHSRRRGACAAYGCRCGIWRPVTLVQGTGNVAATADNDTNGGRP